MIVQYGSARASRASRAAADASTDWDNESEQRQKAVIVYRSKDIENLEAPAPVFSVLENHWARETIWAPEVHRYKGKFYLFVTLTSKDLLPTPEGRPQNRKRGTEILVADRPEGPFRSFANPPQTPHDWMALENKAHCSRAENQSE